MTWCISFDMSKGSNIPKNEAEFLLNTALIFQAWTLHAIPYQLLISNQSMSERRSYKLSELWVPLSTLWACVEGRSLMISRVQKECRSTYITMSTKRVQKRSFQGNYEIFQKSSINWNHMWFFFSLYMQLCITLNYIKLQKLTRF